MALVAIALVTAACGPSVPPASPSPVQPAAIYGCGDPADRFTLAALTGPAGAETGTDEAAAALRLELQGAGPDLGLPPGGWRRVVDDASSVVFVAVGDGDPRWHIVAFSRTPDGVTLDRMGACDLRIVLDDPEVEAADWWPAGPIDAAATSIPILVLERACASGQDASGRIQPPVVTSTPEAVVVVIAVRHREGGQDCQGNPATPFTLELPEPLSGRPLFDGGTLPPREPVPTT
jgi:hypothetical protein